MISDTFDTFYEVLQEISLLQVRVAHIHRWRDMWPASGGTLMNPFRVLRPYAVLIAQNMITIKKSANRYYFMPSVAHFRSLLDINKSCLPYKQYLNHAVKLYYSIV